MKETKKTKMLRRNDTVIKYVKLVLRPEETPRWERFVKEY